MSRISQATRDAMLKAKLTAKETSIRHNQDKTKWSLVDFNSIEGLVKVLEFGVEKYGLDNWKIGLDPNETLESLMRHTIKLLNGEQLDDETNLNHAYHIMANAMFYIYHKNKENELDNK